MSKLFRDAIGARLSSRGSVVCIGAFDGLHIGHRALIEHGIARAREIGAEAAVVSFEPLPREYFSVPADPPSRLLLPRQKIARLCAVGVDRIGLLRFDAALAALPAERFVRELLVKRLAVREVWIGEDFRFGHQRRGDVALLSAQGKEWGFELRVLEPQTVDGERVSSRRIRAALADARLDEAAQLLGWRYSIAGRVVHGNRLGHTLGYPTANIRFGGRKPALSGIFAAWVRGMGKTSWPAVASIGTRPTVGGGEPLLEAHLFDFQGDLYGRVLDVEFAAKLRDEEKFPNLPALVAQMDRDAASARRALGIK